MSEQLVNQESDTDNFDQKQDGIMGDINDMISDLLKNVIGEMQQTDLDRQLSDASQDSGSTENVASLQAEMDISVIRKVTAAMQKFIDNANLMLAQLEGGGSDFDHRNDAFMENYIATADSILEVAAFSTKDPLTGLSNRYGFDSRLVLEWNRAVREQTPLSLIIFGIDGYDCAQTDEELSRRDETFKAVATTLTHTIKRSTDFFSRWSDNEFAALLPLTAAEGAMIVSKRICMEVENMNIAGLKDTAVQAKECVGASIKIPSQNEKSGDYMNAAYEAFIKAKETGGNSIVME